MHILIVNFQLNNLSEQAYREQCEAIAPVFATLPGLISKVWLADAVNNTYGGVYIWQNRAAMERYKAGEVFQRIGANPHFANLTTRDFAVLGGPTALTWNQNEGWFDTIEYAIEH